MKIVDEYPYLTIDYPTKKASVVVIVVFGLPVLLVGLFLLFWLFTGQITEERGIIVLGVAGGVSSIVGALVVLFGINLARRTDRLTIDFNNEKIIRDFGLGPIYDQLTEGDNEYSLDSVDTLFIARDVHTMRTTEEGRRRIRPVYVLICGFQDKQKNKHTLHVGNLTPVTKTVEVLAQKLEKDIWDFTAIEERKILYINTELLKEIRFPSIRFVKITVLAAILVIGLFLLPFVFDFISSMIPGSEPLFQTLSQLSLMAWLLDIIFLAFYMCIGMIRMGLKCPQCGSEKRTAICDHCGLEIPVFITIGFGPCSYRYLLRD
jgi:hypothetical protein